MIIVSSINYDVVAIRWLTTNIDATTETERIKVIDEFGEPFKEIINEYGSRELWYKSNYYVLIVEKD